MTSLVPKRERLRGRIGWERLLWLGVLACGCQFQVEAVDGGHGSGGDSDLAEDLAVPDGGDEDLTSPAPPDLFAPPDGLKPGQIGWPCSAAFECASRFCISGFCCEELCDPLDPGKLCRACNVPGFEGRCVPALDGTDPRGQCPEDPSPSCARDGTCDGAGACRLKLGGTPCGTPSCASGIVSYAPACDGLGTCLPGTVSSCAPYVCEGATRCQVSCAGDAQCAPGNTCNSASCGKHADGEPCQNNGDCTSSHCEQGVCCLTACAQSCYSCAIPGSLGQCRAVPRGQDPEAQCAAQARDTCGNDGTCDGLGACRKWQPVTPCSGPSCAGDALSSARYCDGLGTCQNATTTSCPSGQRCNPANAICDSP